MNAPAAKRERRPVFSALARFGPLRLGGFIRWAVRGGNWGAA